MGFLSSEVVMSSAGSNSRAVVVTHGGAGGPIENSDGCERAAQAGLTALRESTDSLEAVIRATEVLEDDPRLNAGTLGRSMAHFMWAIDGRNSTGRPLHHVART